MGAVSLLRLQLFLEEACERQIHQQWEVLACFRINSERVFGTLDQ
jgi:hypothetical protein